MIDFQILLIVLGVLMIVFIGILVKKLSKVKVWIDSCAKENQPLVRTCYLQKGEEGTAAEVFRVGAFGKPAIGIIKVDEKSIRNRAYVEVLMTDINDDAEKPHYRRTGYISFDQDTSVDKYGYVYKQIKGSKEREVVGYLARPSKPNEPTIYGERSWKDLWLKCVLNAYAGLPLEAENALNETKRPKQSVEKLYFNSPKEQVEPDSEKLQSSEPLVEESQLVVEQAGQEQESVVEDTPSTVEKVAEENKTEEILKEGTPVEEKGQPVAAPLEKPKPKKPMAVCSFWGFHSSKNDVLPAEARAATFALLQRYAPRQRQAEYYSEQPYGWKDTALLSAVIYTILFILVYIVNTGVFQMPLLGKSLPSTAVFVGYYYVLWAIVRYIKIDAIENSYSFQPILDLFNKNLGMKWMDSAIIALCSVAMIFTYFYYDYDFMPLLVVIATGVGINMNLPSASRRWKVQASFLDDTSDINDEEEEENEPQNPQGDISRTYDWDLDDTYVAQNRPHGSLTLYFKAADMRDERHLNPFFDQRKDHSDKENILYMFRFLKKYRKTFLARTNYVVYNINKIAEKNGFSLMDKLQFTLDFVQEPNIAFQENAENKTINFYDDYIRYPDETLYDKCGDSNSKSLLAAMLFHLMGYNVLYLISRKHQHAAVGVEIKKREIREGWLGDSIKIDEIAIKYEGRYFIFCETTGDKFSLGKQVGGMSIEDFDEKMLLPVREEDDELDGDIEENTEDIIERRLYEWDLTSVVGNQLKGKLLLEMSMDDIEALRGINPFVSYGQDNHTYQENVLSIFQYLKQNPSKLMCVRQVTDYIRTTVRDSGCPELDALQFALNFVQEPNIAYVLDERSSSIKFAKEYMRFPDEVLFDKEGDCDCKSSLTAALFLGLGYKVIFLLSQKLKHAAIGVECKDASWLEKLANPDDSVIEYNGVQYLYCETTGTGFHIGQIKEGESIKDFETILELAL